jgi:hypothetical protein
MEGADASDLPAAARAQSGARTPAAASKALPLARNTLLVIKFGATSFPEVKIWPESRRMKRHLLRWSWSCQEIEAAMSSLHTSSLSSQRGRI